MFAARVRRRARAQTRDEKTVHEDMNPRAASTPLEVVFKPYWCSICAKKGLITGEPPPLEMMRKPIATIVEQIGLEEPPIVIFTPHFKILSTLRGSNIKLVDGNYCHADLLRLKSILPKVQIGREGATLDAHERAHLYQIRVEREYAHFSALTGNTKPYLGMPLPYEIYLFAEYAQHHAFVDRYVGGRNDKSAIEWHIRQEKGRAFGAAPTDPEVELKNFILLSVAESNVQPQQKGAKSDGALSNHVFHNVAHLLVDGLDNYLRETPAWIEEGLGHYYERREIERWNNFCWAEGKMPTDFTKPDWESTIFALVRRERDPPFATVVREAAARRALRHRERPVVERRQVDDRHGAGALREDAPLDARPLDEPDGRAGDRRRLRLQPERHLPALARVRPQELRREVGATGAGRERWSRGAGRKGAERNGKLAPRKVEQCARPKSAAGPVGGSRAVQDGRF